MERGSGAAVCAVGSVAFLTLGLATACGGEDGSAIRIHPVRHMEVANALVGAELGPSAIDYLRRFDGDLDLALSADDDFELLSETRAAGLRHVKLQQRHLEVPVLHSQVMVHADDTTFLGFNGYLTANLDGFDVTPEVPESDALAIAEADRAGGASLEYASEEIRLVIRPRSFMNTDDLKTFDMSPESRGLWVTGDSLEDFPDAAINDGHGYAEITLKVMREWMGHDSTDDGGRPLLLRVHADDVRDQTAYFNDDTANFGPTVYDYESSQSLDIVAHEFGHGFTRHHSDLEYSNQSGGLNESFSDVAGTVAEFYFEGAAADFFIGEDLFSGTSFLRQMSAASEWSYEEGLDPHDASAWPNRAFFLAVGRYIASAGVSTTDAVRAMGHVWYTANAAYWTSGTSYEEGCRGTVDAARALGYTSEIAEGIAQSWADTGIECESGTFVCDHDDNCDAGEGETCASCSEDCGDCAEHCSFWKKAKCEVGIGDCSRCDVTEPGCGDHICDGDEDDSNCPLDCGCAALSCDQVAPFGCFCDEGCHDVGDCCADRDDACG